MTALERVAEVLRVARVAGGWIDEDVAAQVLKVLGLDEDGLPRVFSGPPPGYVDIHGEDRYQVPEDQVPRDLEVFPPTGGVGARG